MPDPIDFSVSGFGDNGGGSETNNNPPVEDSGLANPFLAAVEENDRPIVEKYIKDWDAGVTKKFQEIHETYKPYKELGADVDTLSQAMQIVTMLNEDPEETIRILQESYQAYMSETGGTQELNGGSQQQLPEFQGLPPEATEYIKGLESQLSEVKEFMQESKTEKQERQEMEILDKALKDMHTEHGDFDDEYVLVKLANGYSPEDAIKAYNKLVENVSSRKKPPAQIPGSGSLPNGQVDASKIKGPGDRKALISQILEAQQG